MPSRYAFSTVTSRTSTRSPETRTVALPDVPYVAGVPSAFVAPVGVPAAWSPVNTTSRASPVAPTTTTSDRLITGYSR
nr:hypothetical protein [Pengzhenrongella sicca]